MIDRAKLIETELMQRTLIDVGAEISLAIKKHGPTFASMHEAYAVILEELEEFKTEVFKKSHDRDRTNMEDELIQVAASAIKGVITLKIDSARKKEPA
ncbi:MAG: hypothetical protein IT539_07460 [Bradyrhizobiaceae bacterium]|nr:hypothetical protein [Bradyrhizobiaceae bacterium]